MAQSGNGERFRNPLRSRREFIQRDCCRQKLILQCFMAFAFVGITSSSTQPNIEGGALLQLRDSLNDSSNRLRWTCDFVSPCFSWSYVTCRDHSVVALSLATNGFTGTLSPAITKLKFLVTLELQNNSLSGALPDYLGNMFNLQTLNLSMNSFSGSIPASWSQLSNLKHLDLSSNNLTGSIPTQFFSIPTFDFSGTHLICGKSLNQPCSSSSRLPVTSSKKKLRDITLTASCVASIILFLGAMVMYHHHRLRRTKNDIFFDVACPHSSRFKLPDYAGIVAVLRSVRERDWKSFTSGRIAAAMAGGRARFASPLYADSFVAPPPPIVEVPVRRDPAPRAEGESSEAAPSKKRAVGPAGARAGKKKRTEVGGSSTVPSAEAPADGGFEESQTLAVEEVAGRATEGGDAVVVVEEGRDPADVEGAEDRSGGASEGSDEEPRDYSFYFCHKDGNNQVIVDQDECAELAQAMMFGQNYPHFHPAEMVESDAFRQVARSAARTMALTAFLGEAYEKRLAEKDASLNFLKARQEASAQVQSALICGLEKDLREEKARSAAMENEAARIRARAVEVGSLQGELEAERARSTAERARSAALEEEVGLLKGERETLRSRVKGLEAAIGREKVAVAAESDRVTARWEARNRKWTAKMEKIRAHLDGRTQALEPHLLYNQVIGVRAFLKRMEAEDGISVPWYRYQKLDEDEAAFGAQLDEMDFPDLTPEDLDIPLDRTHGVQLERLMPVAPSDTPVVDLTLDVPPSAEAVQADAPVEDPAPGADEAGLAAPLVEAAVGEERTEPPVLGEHGTEVGMGGPEDVTDTRADGGENLAADVAL